MTVYAAQISVVYFTKHVITVMKEDFIKQCVIVLFSCAIGACAAPSERSETAEHEVESRGSDCISQSTIRDYQVLDESNLIFTASGRRKYHVELFGRAFGLRSTWQVGFRSTTGRICSGSGELVVDDGFGRTDRFRISSVRELSPEELDDLLIRFGKKKPEIEQAPTPRDVPGAEVEELD